MNVLVEPIWTHKRGTSPEDYEDAACPMERTTFSGDVRLAVADGATESVFARRWAEQLVLAVCDGVISPRDISAGINKLRTDRREWLTGKSLPWYVEEKARQGAFAAMVALELTGVASEGDPGKHWYAAAVGDCCLFQLRRDDVIIRFPIADPTLFDSRPFLLGSLDSQDRALNEQYANGTWEQGDSFLLMTDALACWFLKYIDSEGKALEVLGSIPTTDIDQFTRWVDSLRQQGTIRNDDSTMIRVSIE